MVKFIEVSPNDIPNVREGRRGRVSYPILKGFMEATNSEGKPMFLAQLDRTGLQQSMLALSSGLNAYIKSHNLPIKLFQRQGQLYLMRLDIDEEGTPIPDWNEYQDTDFTFDAHPVDAEEVAKRFAEEKGQTTK